MIKHTPGPWGYIPFRHRNNPNLDCFEITYGEYGEAIADTVYNEADARLIAAAPVMLEALLEQCHNCAEEKDYCLEHDCKVYMAIKAAKGEQE